MHDTNQMLASTQPYSEAVENTSFSQYLTFRFYKDNFDQMTDATKDSINNFLKSISEIEDDFVTALQSQTMNNMELQNFGFGNGTVYMEENYWGLHWRRATYSTHDYYLNLLQLFFA